MTLILTGGTMAPVRLMGGVDQDLEHAETLRGERALWRLAKHLPDDLRSSLPDRSPMLCHLLYCRGYQTAREISDFFDGGTVSYDPFLLPDMAIAVDRIGRAVHDKQRVAVYGDFDCDGITSAAVLMATLQGLGLEPLVHIPTRADGHGLHPEALAALADQGIHLIVTADCGVTAIEEVRVARGMGMDVIVTDHHEARPDGARPDCPTISPTLPNSEYPCRFLCGVGVAYKLAKALALSLPEASNPDVLLDLVALGTIADVVMLRDENRSLVVRGLEQLRRTERPGLLALLEVASVDRASIDPIGVGFYLAPRINAANRLGTPQLAYDLITASDAESAHSLAVHLSELNQQRQAIVAEHFEHLMAQFGLPTQLAEAVQQGLHPPVLLVSGSWPAGISGLLASKLADTYGLPAFVGSEDDGVASVSARSVPGVRVDEILERCEASLPGGLFLGYGGHSRAGGFRVASENYSLAETLIREEVGRQVDLEDVGSVLAVDAQVSLSQLTLAAARQIRGLAPFGMGFEEPLFLARDVTLLRRSVMGSGKHARFTVQRDGSLGDGVWFGASPAFLSLPLGSRIDVVFHVQINEWRGQVKHELRLRDWRLAS